MTRTFYYILLFLAFTHFMIEAQESSVTGTIEINNSNTEIEFNARHFGVLNVDGTFSKFTGKLEVDHGVLNSGTLLIEVSSISTDNNSRDKSLKSEDFLAAESFPHIKISFDGNSNTAIIPAYATIKGVKQSIQLSYKIDQSQELIVTCTISRKLFSLAFGTMDDLVSDKILVRGLVSLIAFKNKKP